MKNTSSLYLQTLLAALVVTLAQQAKAQTLNPGVIATPAFSFGTGGSGAGQFNALRGVGVGTNGTVYVTDALNYRVQHFTSNGIFMNLWGSSGLGAGQLNAPLDLAVDGSNNVFVADTYNNRIQRFGGNGAFLSQWGSAGSGTGQFSQPRCLAVDRAGNVYVSDTDNNRIQKFTSNGSFLRSWGGLGSAAGKLNTPVGIVADNTGNVYVVDQGNYRIQRFANDGTFLGQWGTQGAKAGQFANGGTGTAGGPNGVTVDRAGNVCVADGGNSRIQVFTSAGVFISQFGSFGVNAGQFNLPGRLAFDPTGTLLYVSDINNNRVQAFNYATPPPMILAFVPTGGAATMAWSAIAGRTYQLQYKTDLNQTNWNNSGSVITATNYPVTALDFVGSDAQRFYHIALLP
jgi:streptogramin lyase